MTFCWFLGGFKYHFHFPNHSFSHGPMGQRWFFIRSNAGPALPPGPWKDPPPPDPQLPPGPGNGKSQKIAAMFCWRSPNFWKFREFLSYNHGSPWFYLILGCKPWFLQQTQFRGLPFPFSRPPSAGTVLGTRSTWAPTSLTPQAPCRASVSWLHQGQSNGQLQLLCMRHIIYIYIYHEFHYINPIKSPFSDMMDVDFQLPMVWPSWPLRFRGPPGSNGRGACPWEFETPAVPGWVIPRPWISLPGYLVV